MPVNKEAYFRIKAELDANQAVLVAVSKTKPVEEIRELYALGQRDFGENYVQELMEKADLLPDDIRWHFIGHLQTNKVKLITPFVQLIQGVDSLKLLKEIQKQGGKGGRLPECLLQVHIAQEETKFGMDEAELKEVLEKYQAGEFPQVRIRGLMGMASLTDDKEKLRSEFKVLKRIYDDQFPDKVDRTEPGILSMGMSGDYRIALEEGSNMVRIGSLLFGERS